MEDGLDGLLALVVGVDALSLYVTEYGTLVAQAPIGLGGAAVGDKYHICLVFSV